MFCNNYRELSSFTWKHLMWTDMIACGASQDEEYPDRMQPASTRGRSDGGLPRKLSSPLALLLHLFESSVKPATEHQQYAGETMLLQYLVRMFQQDLDSRIKASLFASLSWSSAPPAPFISAIGLLPITDI